MRTVHTPIGYIMLLMAVLGCPDMHAQVSSNDGSIWKVPRTGGECITEPSPEPTAIRRYEDYPVSYATGTADISIPLLELTSGQVNVSLGLSYHTGGIKHEELPTNIGLGWSLTGLGSISRQIHGFPDEWLGDDYFPVKHDVREYCGDVDYLVSIIEAKTDAERDIYHYNLPGYSGSFIIVGNEIVALPKTDLVIEREPSAPNSKATNAFTITTPDGSKYLFSEKELIDYNTNDSPRSLPEYKRDYCNTVSSWLLSKITGPDNVDEVTITYSKQRGWTRTHYQQLNSDSFSHYCSADALGYWGYTDLYQWSHTSVSGVSSTKFHSQLVPKAIRTRTGFIGFSSALTPSARPDQQCITEIRQRDNDGKYIKTITLDHSVFSDKRCRLDGVTIKSDNKVIDGYAFDYHDTTNSRGYDIFGYSNGRLDMGGALSIIDNNFSLSLNRRTDSDAITSGTLKTIADIHGTVTDIQYEPSVIDFGEPQHPNQVIYGNTTIGIRIKSITTTDMITDRVRKRSFSYELPQCNINLPIYAFGDFLSYNGTHAVVDVYGHYAYNIGICHTSSLNAYGVPLENSKIYYGKVTEEISGSEIYKNIKTVYEYDLSQTSLKSYAGCYTSPPYETLTLGPNQDQGRFLGIFANANVGYNERRMLSYYSPCGYIEEKFGATPLLATKTEYEWKDDKYIPVRSEHNYYSVHDKERYQVGVHSESRMFKYRGFNGSAYSLNIEDQSDVAFFAIHVSALRSVCDSTVTINYFPTTDSIVSRKVKTQYINTLWELPESADFSFSCHPSVADKTSFYPYGTITSCDDESISFYHILSEYSGGMSYALMRGLKRLPVTEKWVFKTHEGKDSILRNYHYNTYQGKSGTFIRPRQVSVSTLEAPDTYTMAFLSKQIYNAYDSLGRITDMIDAEGRHITARWMDKYDLLSEMSLPDVGLTTTYTYQPLVGCTSITSPSGRKRSFSYSAGRLVEERNTAGEPVVSYSYQIFGDDSPAQKINGITTTIHESTDSATNITYYDGFGMPIQEIKTVAQNKLVNTQYIYDGLNRLKVKFLPVSVSSTSYKFITLANLLDQYNGDFSAYTSIKYPYSKQDRPIEINKEGDKLRGHPEKYEYLCNNTTDAMLRCRRYRLAGSADSESITLDGDYPAGALDVTRVTDPDGCTLLTFTDWRGLRILERRVVSDSQFADTYYLYDILGNVRVILQPEGAAQMTSTTKTWTPTDEVITEFAFINRYDRRGNLTYAKVPGAGPVEMRYDPLNRLAFRQTATMAEQNESEFTLYDPIGRLALTGITDLDIPDEKSIPLMNTTLNSSSLGIDETGYQSPESLDLENDVYNTHATVVNYYDSYNMLSLPGFEIFDEDEITPYANTVAGQVVGTRVSILDGKEQDQRYLYGNQYSIFGYDNEGNEAYNSVISCAPNLAYKRFYNCITKTKYTRQSKPLSKQVSIAIEDSIYEFYQNYVYDEAGYLLRESVSSQIVNNPNKIVNAYYEYDELGRISKRIHNNNLYISYKYNLRGQVSEISSPIFSQKLKYEDEESPCYNGNISQMSLIYSGKDVVKRNYTYDRLNRLTAQSSTDGYNTAYSYNLNSSPLTILRYGMTSDETIGIVDDLTMTYNGNILSKSSDCAEPVVIENSNDAMSAQTDFHFDADGRLIYVSSKENTIEYAFNNQPMAISNNINGSITYTYNALGLKIAQTSSSKKYSRAISRTRLYAGQFEFTWNSQYRKALFARINLPWGYIGSNGNEYCYIPDYQGNIRAVVDSTGTAVQTTDYYPYGLPMATSTGTEVNRYKFGEKEFETFDNLNFHDFEARMLFNDHTLFNRPDPNAIEFTWHSPYIYCAANPINYIDKNGMREWPVDKTYNGGVRRHCNTFGEVRSIRPDGTERRHLGVDINIGAGSNDLGAPVYATHNGIVIRIATEDDKNSGGNRVKIQSENGEVATYYMHLHSIDENISLGSKVSEGQKIGSIGNSGSKEPNTFSPHLHYEMFYKGEHINPAINNQRLVDPQKLIKTDNKIYNGGTLPTISIVKSQGNKKLTILIAPPQLNNIDIIR